MSSEQTKSKKTTRRTRQTESSRFDFDVLLSFAGPEREYARAIYDICKANALKTFLDEEFQHEIWGKNLVEYLDNTYRNRGLYVVALLSATYRNRAYTRVERRAAFDRMIEEAGEYFLPVKTDDAWIDGLPKATAYLDLRVQGVVGICEQLVRKVCGTQGKLTIPPSSSWILSIGMHLTKRLGHISKCLPFVIPKLTILGRVRLR
jgi:hypothetical protein